jgi:hypothetical protein
MRQKLFFLYIPLCLSLILGCRLNKDSQTQGKEIPAIVTFLDSTKASEAIIMDDIDGFYDQISEVEMQIQMKKTKPFESRSTALNAYKKFIAKEVSDWKTEEMNAMVRLFQQVKSLCDTLSPRIFPGGMRLIKVKTNHYGKDVYYTRGRDILIPENIFPLDEESEQLPVMIHEVFHVLSRYNADIRQDMYGLIGFSKAKKPVILNVALQKILLTNPDGVTFQYAIKLEEGESGKMAVPLITSKFRRFHPDNPAFFDYLNFDLYEIKDMGSYYEVTSDTEGKTTIPLKNTPVFFTKIKDNTQYIIHPDEIMADNFMLALLAHSKGEYGKFSKEGKVLINNVLERLRKM